MSTIVPTISYLTTCYVTAASDGDGTTIAALFNGIKINDVNTATAATAANATGAVTISWPASTTRVGNDTVTNIVTGLISAVLTLTSPVTHIYTRTEGKIV